MMTIKGRLLSNTTIGNRFQVENEIWSPPEW